MYRDAVRTFIFISGIVPDLYNIQVQRLRRMGVDHGESVFCKGVDFRLIRSRTVCTGDNICYFLRNSVHNNLTATQYGKIPEGACPAVFFAEHHRVAGFCTVCQQVDGDRIRADAVVIVSIIPYFFYIYLGRRRSGRLRTRSTHVERGRTGCCQIIIFIKITCLNIPFSGLQLGYSALPFRRIREILGNRFDFSRYVMCQGKRNRSCHTCRENDCEHCSFTIVDIICGHCHSGC